MRRRIAVACLVALVPVLPAQPPPRLGASPTVTIGTLDGPERYRGAFL